MRHRGTFTSWWDTPEWRAKNVEVNRLLPREFPELADEYEREVVSTGSEDDGPMVVYSLVFHPFLKHAVLTEPTDSPLLERIFAFLKMLEDHPDSRYSEVATVEVAEFLEHEPEILKPAYSRLGPKVRAVIEEP